MSTCLACNAVFAADVLVCPSCRRALEPDPAPAPSGPYVTLFRSSGPSAMAPGAMAVARAILEGAGIPTMMLNDGAFVPNSAVRCLELQVPEEHVEEARALLNPGPGAT